MLEEPPEIARQNFDLDPAIRLNLLGRYGAEVPELLSSAKTEELVPIDNTSFLWAELRWEARTGGAIHLDDLLMRRVRLGLLLPEGGAGYFSQIGEIVRAETGWSEARWRQEITDYTKLWQCSYALRDIEQ